MLCNLPNATGEFIFLAIKYIIDNFVENIGLSIRTREEYEEIYRK